MNTITATKVREEDRLDFLPKHFSRLAVSVETAVYNEMSRICEDYDGGYWEFYELSNGGFYMALESDDPIRVVNSMNYADEEMTTHSACITTCLFIWNALCWKFPEVESFTTAYYQLYEYALEMRPDAVKIARVID